MNTPRWIVSGCLVALALAGVSLVVRPEFAQTRAAEEAGPSRPDGPPARVPHAPLGYRPELSFDEEFDHFSPYHEATRLGRWRTQFGYGAPTALSSRALANNGERQAYVDADFRGVGPTPISVNPFSLASGVLTITADRAGAAIKPAIWNQDYTSGLISTRFSFAQRYGYFEMRARLPKGKGLWAAFWLLPADRSWPPEIDIVEALGGAEHLYFTPHCAGIRHVSVAGSVKADPDGFHDYGLEWLPDKLTWFVDGERVATAPTCPAMNQTMYILANLAVGGTWPGLPDAQTRFPAHMAIDYIRAWRLPESRIPGE